MKIEKLRNNHKKEIIIGTILTVVIGGVLTLKLTHSKYRVTQSIDLGSGVINYKSYDFKIVEIKTSEDKTNYNDVNIVPTSKYILNSSRSLCNVDNVKDNNITIEYSNGKVNFKNITKKGTKCYLYFDKDTSIDNVDDLIAKVQNEAKAEIPDFSSAATTNEGVFKTTDGMYDNGTTYYWRGAVTNNYVKFAGYCWRIIRINGDGTVRLIYDGDTCHANGTNTTESIAIPNQSYNSAYDASYYVGWTYSSSQRPSETNNNGSVGTASNAKTQLQAWYNSNLKSYESKIANGKYCNDRNVANGYEYTTWTANGTQFYYSAYDRLELDKAPILDCFSGDTYQLKVGLITADEVVFAGGVYESGNSNYYLYNGQNYWTMTPYNWYRSGYSAFMFELQNNRNLYYKPLTQTSGIRPVINLKSDVTFSSGNGEQLTPYVVS